MSSGDLPAVRRFGAWPIARFTGFVFIQQTRPTTPTKSSSRRLPTREACVTDWSFSFRCSPPRIAATQLRFDTARFITAQRRTFTALSPRHLRRTERRPWRLNWWKLFAAMRDLGESYYRKRPNHCHWNRSLKSWRHGNFLSACGLPLTQRRTRMSALQPTTLEKWGMRSIAPGALASCWFGVPALAGEGQDWQANGQGGGVPDRLKPGLRTGNSRMRPRAAAPFRISDFGFPSDFGFRISVLR